MNYMDTAFLELFTIKPDLVKQEYHGQEYVISASEKLDIQKYYKRFGIQVLDVKKIEYNDVCEACYCPGGIYHFLIHQSDLKRSVHMLDIENIVWE